MRTYLVVSAMVFGAIALLHLLRLIYSWPAHVGTLVVPVWLSGIGFLIPGVLCFWGFALARGAKDP
jgi:hypothetical protein